jgi:putative ABC transport system substrate-binding protein
MLAIQMDWEQRGCCVRRREFIIQFGACVTVGPATAIAQESGRTYHVGSLSVAPRNAPPISALVEGLGRIGFAEGTNLRIEGQGFDLSFDELPLRAKELAAARVDVIVALSGDASIRAAQEATRTIPILGVADDMVGSGLVNSLASPGGNVTGVSILSTELDGKRQELLLEMLPRARRIGAILDARTEGPRQIHMHIEAAQTRGVVLEVFRVERSEEIVRAVEKAKASGCEALNVLASPIFYLSRHGLLERCAQLGLPAMYHLPEMAEDGGLIAYGPRILRVMGDQLPRLFQKLMQGAKPAELPVERPTQVDLVLNLKTAKALGLTVPQTLLAQAADLIE